MAIPPAQVAGPLRVGVPPGRRQWLIHGSESQACGWPRVSATAVSLRGYTKFTLSEITRRTSCGMPLSSRILPQGITPAATDRQDYVALLDGDVSVVSRGPAD